jgi:hypothetical protein
MDIVFNPLKERALAKQTSYSLVHKKNMYMFNALFLLLLKDNNRRLHPLWPTFCPHQR